MAGFVSGMREPPGGGWTRLEGLSPATKTPVPHRAEARMGCRGATGSRCPPGPTFLPDTTIHGLPGQRTGRWLTGPGPRQEWRPATQHSCSGSGPPGGHWCSQHQLPEAGPLTALNPVLWIRGRICRAISRPEVSVIQDFSPAASLLRHPWPGHLVCACSVAQSRPTL